MHAGIDIASHWKTPIKATSEGVVIRAGFKGPYGRLVEIDHGNGFRTRYGHLEVIKVKKGQHVDQGDIVGLMGTSGRSTNTHVHYEIWFGNHYRNPMKFLRAAKHVREG